MDCSTLGEGIVVTVRLLRIVGTYGTGHNIRTRHCFCGDEIKNIVFENYFSTIYKFNENCHKYILICVIMQVSMRFVTKMAMKPKNSEKNAIMSSNN